MPRRWNKGVADRLEDRFRLLTTGRRTSLPRHRPLRGTLDWSYDLLTERERVVLRRLAIFAGSFTLPAVSVVAADDEIAALEVVESVANLVSKSLVTGDAGGAARRYRLLETTRGYALENSAAGASSARRRGAMPGTSGFVVAAGDAASREKRCELAGLAIITRIE